MHFINLTIMNDGTRPPAAPPAPLLRNFKELPGAEQAASGVHPAYERLVPNHGDLGQGEDGLVEHRELISGDRVPQLVRDGLKTAKLVCSHLREGHHPPQFGMQIWKFLVDRLPSRWRNRL
jgi:hypothetical protein